MTRVWWQTECAQGAMSLRLTKCLKFTSPINMAKRDMSFTVLNQLYSLNPTCQSPSFLRKTIDINVLIQDKSTYLCFFLNCFLLALPLILNYFVELLQKIWNIWECQQPRRDIPTTLFHGAVHLLADRVPIHQRIRHRPDIPDFDLHNFEDIVHVIMISIHGLKNFEFVVLCKSTKNDSINVLTSLPLIIWITWSGLPWIEWHCVFHMRCHTYNDI